MSDILLNNRVCTDLTFTQANFPFFILEMFGYVDSGDTMWGTIVESDGETEWEGIFPTLMDMDYLTTISSADKGMPQGREMCKAIW